MSANHCPPIAADNPSVGRALVLAGGGMRVAYQAGAVKALIDEGLRFSHADGASGGTINWLPCCPACRPMSCALVGAHCQSRSLPRYGRHLNICT